MIVTVNDVRDGVIAALDSLYPDVNIHDEEIEQGLVEPRFFVKLLTGGHAQVLGRRYKRSHAFDVHYFSKTNEDRHAVAEKLYKGLEHIPVAAGTVRGIRMQHEIIDGVLHFFVDYDFHVMRQKDPETKMQTLEQEASFQSG